MSKEMAVQHLDGIHTSDNEKTNTSEEAVVPNSNETIELINNIRGILNNLKIVLEEGLYKSLEDEFESIIGSNDYFNSVALEDNKVNHPIVYNGIIVTSGASKRKNLRAFASNLSVYEPYYTLYTSLNNLRTVLDNNDSNLDEQKKEIVDKTVNIINSLTNLTSALAPNLIKTAIDYIYEGLILTDDDSIIQAINNNDSIRESIGLRIQSFVTTHSKQIDYDNVDHDGIRAARLKDPIFSERLDGYIKTQVLLEAVDEQIRKSKEKLIEAYDNKINANNREISDYKAKRRKAIIKKVVISSVLPLYLASGYVIGKDVSKKRPLWETFTQVVDITDEQPKVLDNYSILEEETTGYVSSVSIAEPWEQTISGVDVYNRNVYVYEFTKPEDAPDNYRLKKEDLVSENLSLKYHYKETSKNTNNTDKGEIIVTETWQDREHPHDNDAPVSAGLGWGFFLGVLTLAGGYFLNRELNFDDDVTSFTPIYECNKAIDKLEKANAELKKQKQKELKKN